MVPVDDLLAVLVLEGDLELNPGLAILIARPLARRRGTEVSGKEFKLVLRSVLAARLAAQAKYERSSPAALLLEALHECSRNPLTIGDRVDPGTMGRGIDFRIQLSPQDEARLDEVQEAMRASSRSEVLRRLAKEVTRKVRLESLEEADERRARMGIQLP